MTFQVASVLSQYSAGAVLLGRLRGAYENRDRPDPHLSLCVAAIRSKFAGQLADEL